MYQFSLHQYLLYAVAISINKCFLLCCHFIISSLLSVTVVACFSCRFDFPYQFLTKFISLLSQPLSLSSSQPPHSLAHTHALNKQPHPSGITRVASHLYDFSVFFSLAPKTGVASVFLVKNEALVFFLIKTSARSKKYLTPNFL